jgi:septal ring factor EnvC (AmiA/AmiB activator)
MDEHIEAQLACIVDELRALETELRAARRKVANVEAHIRDAQKRRTALEDEGDRQRMAPIWDFIAAESTSAE